VICRWGDKKGTLYGKKGWKISDIQKERGFEERVGLYGTNGQESNSVVPRHIAIVWKKIRRGCRAKGRKNASWGKGENRLIMKEKDYTSVLDL